MGLQRIGYSEAAGNYDNHNRRIAGEQLSNNKTAVRRNSKNENLDLFDKTNNVLLVQIRNGKITKCEAEISMGLGLPSRIGQLQISGQKKVLKPGDEGYVDLFKKMVNKLLEDSANQYEWRKPVTKQ